MKNIHLTGDGISVSIIYLVLTLESCMSRYTTTVTSKDTETGSRWLVRTLYKTLIYYTTVPEDPLFAI